MKKTIFRLATALLLLGVFFISPGTAHAAACSVPSPNYGSVSTTISVPADATYRIWTRMMAPDTTNNKYALEIDGTTCYTVGGTSLSPNTWTWVDYQNGSVSNKIQQTLTAGNHTVKFIGVAPNVKLDKLIVASDLTCVISDGNTSCVPPADTTPPTLSLTAPANGATVSGPTKLTASASDNTGISKVDFYANSTLLGSDTSSPYEQTWDASLLPNANYTISAKAYDQAGNFATAQIGVSVKNGGDTSAPTTPQSVTAAASAYNKVTVTWKSSSDDVGVVGYTVWRNNAPVAQLGNVATYTDTTVVANTSYSYQVTAKDAAGNVSTASTAANVKTPAVSDSQAPSAPGEPRAEVVGPTQANLSWAASTDNTGVTAYDVYRKASGGQNAKVATVATPSFGDASLVANTTYEYYVVARDAAGNSSKNSTILKLTTPANKETSELVGYVRTASGAGIKGALVETYSNGRKVRALTDTRGFYEIDPISSGSHSITYSATGYKSATSWREVGIGRRIANNVNLQQ